MVEVLGALGLLAFAVASIAVGVRCLLRGIRSGAVPELSVGAGFLVGVLLGYLPESIVTSSDLLPPALAASVLMGTQVAIRLAAIAVMVFTVSVFGGRSRRGPILFGLVLTGLLTSWIAFPYYVSQARGADDRLWYEVFSLSRSLAVAWGAAEALVYYRGARRRRDLGLADPLVTNRFLLWGLGLAALTGLMASTTLAGLAGVDPTSHGWLLLESGMGMVGAISLWLAFFPTRAYRALVVERARPHRAA